VLRAYIARKLGLLNCLKIWQQALGAG